MKETVPVQENWLQMIDIYAHLWDAHGGGDYTLLDRSLNPRPAASLMEMANKAGAGPGYRILDAGCGRGFFSRGLADRYGCFVTGLDPVPSNLETATWQASFAESKALISFSQGLIEHLPFQDRVFDMVWCRDMLLHVPDIESAVVECGRILKPGGYMIVMATVATDLMYPGEADRLFAPLNIIGRNLWQKRLEEIFDWAGLEIIDFEDHGSEYLEYIQEVEGRYSREFVRLGRMVRAKELLSSQLGQTRFEIAMALYYWVVYLLIGKLGDVVYLLKYR